MKQIVLACDFCGKPSQEGLRLIATKSDIAICEECLRVAMELLGTDPQSPAEATTEGQ